MVREGAGKAGYVGQVHGGLGQQHVVPQENQMETLLPPELGCIAGRNYKFTF